MNIDVSIRGEECIITLRTESLSSEIARELKKIALREIKKGRRKLLLDLSQTQSIDHGGIGKLLFLNKKMEILKGRFAISQINEHLYRSLESLGIPEVIPIPRP